MFLIDSAILKGLLILFWPSPQYARPEFIGNLSIKMSSSVG